MQIENAPLLNVQNTYNVKKSSVSNQTNSVSAESDHSSSVINAGPAAVFEKGGTTNGMTGSAGVSRTAPMGSAGMLYAAGIMPTALEEGVPVAQENSAANSTGMNIAGVTLLESSLGTIKGAEWSATINPGDIRDGSVISINGITFEFDTDNSTHTDTTKIDISGAGTPGSAGYANAIAGAFSTAIQNNTVLAAKIYGKELPTTAVNPKISCSWNQETANNTTTWKLKLTQASDWDVAQVGNAFEVETGKFVGDTIVGAIQLGTNANTTQINVNNLNNEAVMKFNINGKERTFAIQIETDKPDKPDNLISGGNTIHLYQPTEGESLQKAVQAALNEIDSNYKDQYTVTADVKNGIAGITITPKDSTNTAQPVLSFSQDGVFEAKDISSTKAAVDTPASLKYTVVDIDKLQNGDYFRFRDMCFIFADPDKPKPEISLGDKVNPVYVDMSRGSTTDTEAFAKKVGQTFKNTFDTYFAPSTSGVAPSRGGSDSSDMLQYSSHSQLPRYDNPGKFDIQCSTSLSNGKWQLTIKITAVSPELLKEILLGDNEGWGRSATKSEESTDESGATGTDETTEPSESTEPSTPETGETPDATGGDSTSSTPSAPDSTNTTTNPAAPSQPETNAPTAVQNGDSEQNEAAKTKDASTNSIENTTDETETKTNPAADKTETTEQTNKEEPEKEENAVQEPQNPEN